MRTLYLALAFLWLSNSAFAAELPKPRGDIFTIEGIAFAYQDVLEEGKNGAPDKLGPVVALDVVAALDDDNPTVVADCSTFKTMHKGALWCFASAEHLARFSASRDKEGTSKYEPAFGGYCALGLSRMNAKVPGADPRTMVRVSTILPQPRQVLLGNGGFGARATFFGTASGMERAEAWYLSLKRSGTFVPLTKLGKTQ
ncbi:MAG: hypothetical protein KBE09_04025 [Candidatus Pacebacteria bacterium]|nr:hypothetical protein [Candidatus Paceibacterota bacterium]